MQWINVEKRCSNPFIISTFKFQAVTVVCINFFKNIKAKQSQNTYIYIEIGKTAGSDKLGIARHCEQTACKHAQTNKQTN